MLLQNKVQGKPRVEPQELDEAKHWFPNEERGSNQVVQNETLTVQDTRDVIYHMTDICHQIKLQPASSGNSCTKGWYLCYGYVETVCEERSFQCAINIPTYGFPKCAPVYHFVKIDLGSAGKRKVRRTRACRCAQ